MNADIILFSIAPISALIALIFAYMFYKKIMKLSEGTDRMKEIAEAVRQGAKAYIRQQYKIVIIFFIMVTDEIKGFWHYIPFIMLPLSYSVVRIIFYFIPVPYYLSLSLLLMIVSTVVTIVFLLRYKTNKFKTKAKMEALRVEDGPRRIIEQ